jgi:hypothetical protein
MTTPIAPPPPSSHPPSRALERLAELLREQGGLMASLLDGDPSDTGPADTGPSDTGLTGESPTLHNSQPLAVGPLSNGGGPAQIAAAGPRAQPHAPEADLGLLAGDQLYALGLARLVALGDLEAVAELADVIAFTALAQGEGRGDLALAIWVAGARTVGWGPSDLHRRAKALVQSGEPGALEAMRAAAEPRVTDPQ